jgi:hypothetical protein
MQLETPEPSIRDKMNYRIRSVSLIACYLPIILQKHSEFAVWITEGVSLSAPKMSSAGYQPGGKMSIVDRSRGLILLAPDPGTGR